MAIEVSIHTQQAYSVHGVWGKSSDKTVAKDIPSLSEKYYGFIGKPPESVLPFFVLSRDYDKATGQFDLFIGGDREISGLETYYLPAGVYGKIVVKPKLGLFWGLAVGEAKRYFYTKWLPASNYEAKNMEYEYHTEKSVSKKPEIDLIFAIRKKQN